MNLERLRSNLEQFLSEYEDRVDEDTTEAVNVLLDRIGDILYEDEDLGEDLDDEVSSMYSEEDDSSDDDDDN